MALGCDDGRIGGWAGMRHGKVMPRALLGEAWLLPPPRRVERRNEAFRKKAPFEQSRDETQVWVNGGLEWLSLL